jgi:LacI family transcriptional regulator
MGLPLVFFDRISKKLKTPSVTTNNYEGGIQATMHLIEAGSKKPAYFSLSQNLSINQNRMKGYLAALEKKGMPNCTYILQGGYDHEVNVGIMSKLLKSSDRPDGVFACVEELAIATYEACSSVGLRIPEDVKVVCFSNLHTASLLQPSLTTIRQPAFEIGKAAAIILFNLLESNEKIEYSNEKKIIDSILVKRNSTAVH